MKSILFSLLLFAFPAFAQQQVWMMVAGAQEEPVSAPGYLLSEDFEGTGEPIGWSKTASGTIDYDYATTPLIGGQSLRIASTATQARTTNVLASATGDVYLFFKFMAPALVASQFVALRADDGTLLAQADLTGTGLFTVRCPSSGQNTAAGTSAGHTNSVWLHYTKGTGANAVLTVGWADNSDIEPTSGNNYKAIANGTSTLDVRSIEWGRVGNSTYEWIIDKVRVSASPIGSNPE